VSQLREQPLDVGQISRRCDFGIGRGARDEANRLADQFARGGIVRDVEIAGADFSERAADDIHSKCLRGLHRAKSGAIHVVGNGVAIGSLLDGVGDELRGDGCSGFARGIQRGGDQLQCGARSRSVLDGDELCFGRKRCKTVPHRVLTFRAADDEAVWFGEFELLCEFSERALHSVPDDEDNFINAWRVVEALPRMGNDGAPSYFEEELVHVRSHARAFACGDDDNAVHFGTSLKSEV